ncbi:hypothetical protein ACWDRR_35400 [Kitasatospora sp. NPDC003701]
MSTPPSALPPAAELRRLLADPSIPEEARLLSWALAHPAPVTLTFAEAAALAAASSCDQRPTAVAS